MCLTRRRNEEAQWRDVKNNDVRGATSAIAAKTDFVANHRGASFFSLVLSSTQRSAAENLRGNSGKLNTPYTAALLTSKFLSVLRYRVIR